MYNKQLTTTGTFFTYGHFSPHISELRFFVVNFTKGITTYLTLLAFQDA